MARRAELARNRKRKERGTFPLTPNCACRGREYHGLDVRIYEQGHAESLEEYRARHLAADIRFAESVMSTGRTDDVVRVPRLEGR